MRVSLDTVREATVLKAAHVGSELGTPQHLQSNSYGKHRYQSKATKQHTAHNILDAILYVKAASATAVEFTTNVGPHFPSRHLVYVSRVLSKTFEYAGTSESVFLGGLFGRTPYWDMHTRELRGGYAWQVADTHTGACSSFAAGALVSEVAHQL